MQIKWKFNYYKNSLLSGIKAMFCVATCCPHSSYTFPKYVFRTGQDRTGQDRTGQDRTGQDRIG